MRDDHPILFSFLSFPKKKVVRQSLSKAQDILVEWQRETTLTQILGHFLSIVSEMLTLVLCIFFLKQWLAFDLFRGPFSGSGGPEAGQSIYNNNSGGVLNSNKKALKNNTTSKNTKRFWKRKNRSRSPSRSVGRSETEEVFTSSEDDISSISIDDVSSDDESSDEDHDEVWDEVKESVTSDVTNSNNDIADEQDLDISDDDEEEEECSSLASDLSWFQDHYYTTEDPRYLLLFWITDPTRWFGALSKRELVMIRY